MVSWRGIIRRHGDRLEDTDREGLEVRNEVYPPLTDVLNLDTPGSEGGQLVGQNLPGILRAKDIGLGRRKPCLIDLPPVALFVAFIVVLAAVGNA